MLNASTKLLVWLVTIAFQRPTNRVGTRTGIKFSMCFFFLKNITISLAYRCPYSKNRCNFILKSLLWVPKDPSRCAAAHAWKILLNLKSPVSSSVTFFFGLRFTSVDKKKHFRFLRFLNSTQHQPGHVYIQR